MKYLSSPPFWLFFGFIGYPFVCLLNGFLVSGLVDYFHPTSANSVNESGLGLVFAALLLGVPLGLVSMFSAVAWQDEYFGASRWLAFIGGITVALSLGWGIQASQPNPPLLAQSGFLLTALVWAACLILFAVYARVPKVVAE